MYNAKQRGGRYNLRCNTTLQWWQEHDHFRIFPNSQLIDLVGERIEVSIRFLAQSEGGELVVETRGSMQSTFYVVSIDEIFPRFENIGFEAQYIFDISFEPQPARRGTWNDLCKMLRKSWVRGKAWVRLFQQPYNSEENVSPKTNSSSWMKWRID